MLRRQTRVDYLADGIFCSLEILKAINKIVYTKNLCNKQNNFTPTTCVKPISELFNFLVVIIYLNLCMIFYSSRFNLLYVARF